MKTRNTLFWSLLACWPLAGLCQVKAGAIPASTAAASRPTVHPWQAPPSNISAEAYFTNLQNGASIETPYKATFGLAGGWGLASIASPVAGKSGHHHLLVNRDLPLDFQQALPFNDQYIHFGKGQMETVLTLAPGTYTLRLLLADDKHLPRFVYSKPLKITVTRKNKDVDPKSLIKKEITLLNMAPGGRQKSPFRLQFQASALNVSHMSQKEKDTGHFRLTLTPQGASKPAEMDFIQGQTEVWLAPPAGAYTVKLDFVDNLDPTNALVDSVSAALKVE